MHLLHCLTHSIHGGGQAVPFLLIKNLQIFHPEIRHTVMLPPNGIFVDRFKELGVKIVEFPFNKVHPANYFLIREILRDLIPNMIHTHGRGAGLYIRSISKKDVPALRIHTHHGFHIPENLISNVAFVAAERLYDKNTDVTIAVSDSEREEIVKVIGPKNPVITIPNIVDPVAVKKLANEPIGYRYSFERFSVVMIGRDDPVKDYHLAFSVAENVLKHTDRVQFFFIGLEPDHPGITALQRKHPENIFATGLLQNPLPLLREANLLLITSKREGAPLSVLEALTLGKPVIGSDVRGIQDLIIDGETGFLIGGDARLFAQKIIELKDDPIQYSYMSKQAVEYTERKCNVRSWSEKYVAIYSSFREWSQ